MSAHSPDRANRLVHESSPCLLLHAHNPVDWLSWSEAASTCPRPVHHVAVGASGSYGPSDCRSKRLLETPLRNRLIRRNMLK